MTIVLLVAVVVMNNLSPFQRAANDLFHHNDVLAHVAVRVSAPVCGLKDQTIPVLHDVGASLAGRVALLRTEPRAIVSSGTNLNRQSALSAARRAPLCPALLTAKVPTAVELAGWTVPRLAARGALNIGAQRAAPIRPTNLKSPRRTSGRLSAAHRQRVALRIAVNAAELESAGWEIDLRSAGRAVTFHSVRVPRFGGRWKQKDMGHFEFVP